MSYTIVRFNRSRPICELVWSPDPVSSIRTNDIFLAETHAALGQSHAKTFEDIKLGRLKTIKDGRRR